MKVPFDGYQGRLLICFLFPYNIGHPGFSFLSPEYFSTPIPTLNSSILHGWRQWEDPGHLWPHQLHLRHPSSFLTYLLISHLFKRPHSSSLRMILISKTLTNEHRARRKERVGMWDGWFGAQCQQGARL